MSNKTMNAGRSLRFLMDKHDISCEKLGEDLKVSATTVSLLRKKTLMSGKNIVSLSDYFGVSCADFIKEGEE